MLEKGFSQPTERVKRLRQVIIDATPQVESDRARLITESYKETEGLSTILRERKQLKNYSMNFQ